MTGDAFRELLVLLGRLREAGIHHELAQHRDDAVMIQVAVPGERWEIELVDYGDSIQVEVERFVSQAGVGGEALLDDLFARHAEPKTERVTADG